MNGRLWDLLEHIIFFVFSGFVDITVDYVSVSLGCSFPSRF